jgi:hypothetical protein
LLLDFTEFGVWCALSARRSLGYVQVILRQFFSDLTEEE